MTDANIRIVVADDHPLMRGGVVAYLSDQSGMSIVGEAGDGREAVETVERLRPDILLLDLHMPVLDGIAVMQAVARSVESTRIIVLTNAEGDALAARAIRLGAAGYLFKSSMRQELVKAIQVVRDGGRWLQPEVASVLALAGSEDRLSPREAQILSLIAKGNANKRIATILGISEETIKGHLRSAFTKLGVGDRAHAVAIAIKRGIIDL